MYVHCYGQKFSGVLEEFSITSRVSHFKNAKINFLKKISVLSAVLFDIKYR